MGLRDSLSRMLATPSGDLAGPKSGVTGADGESHYAGIWESSSDINPLFRGRGRYLVYNDMRFSDPSVRAILFLYKLPGRAAHWDVEPAGKGKDAVDKQVAQAVKWQFGIDGEEGKLSLSHDEWLTQRFLTLDWGAVWEEIVWGDIDWWRPEPDAEQRMVRPIARMALRRPSTIAAVDYDSKTGKIQRVTQDMPDVLPIPGDKLAHYCVERDGETDWMGTSILRAMYGVWRMKKALLLSSAMAWDRWGMGFPVARYPQGGGRTKEERAKAVAQNVRGHERAYAVFEGTPDQGWDLDIKTATINDPVGLLRHYDQQMALGALTMFSGLGVTDTGSRAVGESLAEPYYLAIKSVAEGIAYDTTRGPVRRFVDVNFGVDVETPNVVVRKIRSRDVERVVNMLSLLAGAGFNVRTLEVLNDVLAGMDLSQLPEGTPAIAEGQAAFPGARRTPPTGSTPAARPGSTGSMPS